ncbi:hypothetical protein ACH492_36400 [Streptomyces sp. NPDC019443]|uniref:hypothetical protein n=1 Tax=Streptomyces sp. NPDC019443 TaxID=3365061 RepID=UPI0037A56E64
MSRGRRGERLLRAAVIPLVLGGIALHLWLGTKVGLVIAALGLGLHGVAVMLGRRWITRWNE